MIKGGFTIIELVIALAITMILLMIGVPRYNRSIQQQEFKEVAVQLQDCINRAQQAAGSGAAATTYKDGDIRYSVVDISMVEKTTSGNPYPVSLRCRNFQVPGSVTPASLVFVDANGDKKDDTYNSPVTKDTDNLDLYWTTRSTSPNQVGNVLQVTGVSDVSAVYPSASTQEGMTDFLLVFDKLRGGKLTYVKSNSAITGVADNDKIFVDTSNNNFLYHDILGLKVVLTVAELQLKAGHDIDINGASKAIISISPLGDAVSMDVQAIKP